MRTTIFILLLCRVILAVGQGQNSSKMILYNGYVFVEAIFEKYDKSVLFLFDTGTDHFKVNNDLVKALNLKKGDTLEFTLGDIEMKSSFSFPIDNSQSDSLTRQRLGDVLKNRLYGGIIGNPVFEGNYIIIDYPNKELTVYSPNNDEKFMRNEKDIIYTDYLYETGQIFIQGSINKRVKGYFHLDTGIPDFNILEYEIAKKADLSDLKSVPNTSNKIEHKYIYDKEGNPINRISQVVGKINHQEPSSCSSFRLGEIELSKQYFRTMDTDLDIDVFSDANLNPIIGSIAFETMKSYQIHIDFVNRKIAFVKH